MNKGFIPMVVLAIIGLVALVTAGGAYGVYQFKQLEKENQRINVELATQKQKEDVRTEEVVTASATTTPPPSNPSTTVATSSKTESKPTPAPVTPKPGVMITTPPTPVVVKEIPVEKTVEVSATPVALSINNIKAETTETTAKITWETSVDSDSRLVLHIDDKTKIFVSPNSGSKEHKVEINNLTDSTQYSYEIIAVASSGGEVSKYGSFTTTRVFTAQYIPLVDSSCFTIAIKDTANVPLVGETVEIMGGYYVEVGGYVSVGIINAVTNKDGEVQYCKLPRATGAVVSIDTKFGYTFKTNDLSSNVWEVTRPR